MRSIWPRKVASALMRAPLMLAAPSEVIAGAPERETNGWLICS
jgi:hypothetical protein